MISQCSRRPIPAGDVDEATRLGYWSTRGVTARTARGRIHEVALQVPIRIGNTTFSPGDYIATDRSGCVIVQTACVAETRAEAILTRSEEMVAAVEPGTSVSKVMGREYESMLKGGNHKRSRG